MNLEEKQLDEDVLENSELLVACYFIIESAVSYLSSQGYEYWLSQFKINLTIKNILPWMLVAYTNYGL